MCSLTSTIRYCCVGPAPFDDIGDIPYADGAIGAKDQATSRRSPEVPHLPVWPIPIPNDPHEQNTCTDSQLSGDRGGNRQSTQGSEMDASRRSPLSQPRKTDGHALEGCRITGHVGDNVAASDVTTPSPGNDCSSDALDSQDKNRDACDDQNRNNAHDTDNSLDVQEEAGAHPDSLKESGARWVVQRNHGNSFDGSNTDYGQFRHDNNTSHSSASETSDNDESLSCANGPQKSNPGLLSKMTSCVQSGYSSKLPEFHSIETLPPFGAPKRAWEDHAETNM